MRKKKDIGLETILNRLPEDKRPIGEKLIRELVFMEKTLERLRIQIEETGEIEHFQQGKQDFYRESPALKAYNSTVQRYSVMCRQLSDMMGKSAEAEKSNAVYDFIKANAV